MRDSAPSRRAVAAALGAAALLPCRAPGARAAVAGNASDWSVTTHARVRLIDAGAAPGDPARRLAGLQVELDPAYLTYWRSPGEAGVPPTASFAGSKGLRAAALLFPAPGRYSEDGTEAVGYKDGVVFPILVTPADAAGAVTLAVALHFAICERQCLPVEAQVGLLLGGDGGEGTAGPSPEAAFVREALARVPAPARLGGAGPLSITAVDGRAGDATLAVHARTAGADVPLLFPEAPDPWFVQSGEGLWTSDGTLRYDLKVEAKPADPMPLPLRLTLVDANGAIDVSVMLAPPAVGP